MKSHCEAISTLHTAMEAPDRDRALQDYRATVGAVNKFFGISEVPLTTRPLTDIFTMACLRQPPFRDKGVDAGFKDAVIFLSIIDHLMGTDEVGALVSVDGIFRDAKIVEFGRNAGARLMIYSSVEAVYDAMKQEFQEIEKRTWDLRTENVRRRLTLKLEAIQKFIEERLQIPEWGLVGPARLLAVPHVEVLEIRQIRLPSPEEADKVEQIRFSFDVGAKLHARFEKMELPKPRWVKVGDEGSTDDPESFGQVQLARIFSEIEEAEVMRVVRVDAKSSPKYEEFEFESARLVPENTSEAIAMLINLRPT